jgi:hypothetical protein
MNDEHRGSPATVSKSVIWSKVGAEITEPAPSRSVRAVDEETMRVGYHDKPIAHQVFVLVVNGWLLSRVAHPL